MFTRAFWHEKTVTQVQVLTGFLILNLLLNKGERTYT